MEDKIKITKAFKECKAKAIKAIKTCFHPHCTERSINSHILQKNGILSSVADNGHVMEMQTDNFRNPRHHFVKVGINEAFSFNCFCIKHDTDLFKSIETSAIDFTNYRTLLLFTLRTIYNEKFRKLVNISTYECLISNHDSIFNIHSLAQQNHQENLGLRDIEQIENLIWNDLNSNEESFVFKVRKISKKDICMSAFYTYETSRELEDYFRIHRKNKEEVIDIFVNLFPYNSSSIFMMGYKKKNEMEVKGYVNEFFSDNEKRLERKITNLMMFQCETWAISNKLYVQQISGNDKIFDDAVNFSSQNYNERQFFDLNIFKEDFKQKFESFKRKFGIT